MSLVKVVTVPAPKDATGDLSDVSNYRPITISPVISKIFEYCLLHKYVDSLQSSGSNIYTELVMLSCLILW